MIGFGPLTAPAAPPSHVASDGGDDPRPSRENRTSKNQALRDIAVPSSAPSARSTEQEMHVNVGVSRSV
jgi:hypothetical protein